MVTLLARIKADQLTARKARDTVTSNVLGTVIGACETLSKDPKIGRDLTDTEVMTVVQTTGKKVAETVALLADKPDRALELTKYQREAEILAGYLPQQMTADELTKIALAQSTLGKNVGQIMGYLKATYPGRYDAKIASDIVKGVVSG